MKETRMTNSTDNQANLTIGTAVAAPGELTYGEIEGIEYADGTVVRVPVVLATGAKPGQRLYLGAAIHGDEICGVEAVHRLLASVDLAEMSGTIIAIPVQNPIAMAGQHRLPQMLVGKSPMDQMPGDTWQCFPGDANGNSLQRMAAKLWDVMMQADVVVDVHTPTTGGRYQPYAFLPPASFGAAAERAMELAKVFGPNYVLDTDAGVYVLPGTPHVELARVGVPAFGIEIGEGGLIEEEVADDAVIGLTNVLIHLGFIDAALSPRPEPMLINGMTAVRTSRGGLLHTHHKLGAAIDKGDLLATITDTHGRVVEEIFAPHSGPLMRTTTFATVAAGERVAQLAVPR
jgi:predicted deacylase